VKIVVLSWLFASCVLTGPVITSDFDLTGDARFDLRDVALLQNSAQLAPDGTVEFRVEVFTGECP